MTDELETVKAVDERFNVRCLGVEIGTASGWDSYSEQGVQFYQFEPCDKLRSLFEKKPDTFAIDFDDGEFVYWPVDEVQNGNGVNIDRAVFVKALAEIV